MRSSSISDFRFPISDFRFRSGFTLVEMIAVMAVMAALAAVVTPTIIRRVDRAAWTRETADLLQASGFNFTDLALGMSALTECGAHGLAARSSASSRVTVSQESS